MVGFSSWKTLHKPTPIGFANHTYYSVCNSSYKLLAPDTAIENSGQNGGVSKFSSWSVSQHPWRTPRQPSCGTGSRLQNIPPSISYRTEWQRYGVSVFAPGGKPYGRTYGVFNLDWPSDRSYGRPLSCRLGVFHRDTCPSLQAALNHNSFPPLCSCSELFLSLKTTWIFRACIIFWYSKPRFPANRIFMN